MENNADIHLLNSSSTSRNVKQQTLFLGLNLSISYTSDLRIGTIPQKTMVYVWIHSENLQRNLTTAMQVLIDTALWHCEVSKSVVGNRCTTNVRGPRVVVGTVVLYSSAYLCHIHVPADHWWRHGVLMVVMVKPACLGSVGIRKEDGRWRGCASCSYCQWPYTLVVFFSIVTFIFIGSAFMVLVGFVVLMALTN